jgi:hypothetical protein
MLDLGFGQGGTEEVEGRAMSVWIETFAVSLALYEAYALDRCGGTGGSAVGADWGGGQGPCR